MAGNVRKNFKKKAPAIGELINPITLARKETLPDGDVSFTRKLKFYRTAKAKIEERNRETSDPDLDFHEDITHEFIIRTYTGENIENHSDVVLHDNYIYDIQYVTRLIDGVPYLKLVCTKDKPISDYDYEKEEVAANTTNQDDATQFPSIGDFI